MEVIVVSCRESHIWNGAVIEKYFGYVSVVREKPDQFCSSHHLHTSEVVQRNRVYPEQVRLPFMPPSGIGSKEGFFGNLSTMALI